LSVITRLGLPGSPLARPAAGEKPGYHERDRLAELAHFVAHDDDRPAGRGGDVVRSAAPNHVAEPASRVPDHRGVQIAELVRLEPAQKADIHPAVVKERSQDIGEAAEHLRPIPDPRIRQADSGVDRLGIDHPQLEQDSHIGGVSQLGQE
jgi:hypothetical protein